MGAAQSGGSNAKSNIIQGLSTNKLNNFGHLYPKSFYNQHTLKFAQKLGPYKMQDDKKQIKDVLGPIEMKDCRYLGQVMNKKRHGWGKAVWENFRLYEGEWDNDQMSGKGRCIGSSGTSYYDGEWKNGKRHGKGKMVSQTRGRYNGYWFEDCFDGFGKYTDVSGGKYQGFFVKGKFEGFGKYSWTTGQVYEGFYKNNMMEGEGVMYYLNKDIFKGRWKDNKKNGPGAMIFADGEVCQAVWLNGEIKGEGKSVVFGLFAYEGFHLDYLEVLRMNQSMGKGSMFLRMGHILKDNLLKVEDKDLGLRYFQLGIGMLGIGKMIYMKGEE